MKIAFHRPAFLETPTADYVNPARLLYGCSYKLGVHFLGVPLGRDLLIGDYDRTPDFWATSTYTVLP